MLSSYGKPHTTVITVLGLAGMVAALAAGWWWTAAIVLIAAVALLAFFRDPDRSIPILRGQVVASADGRISSIHTLDHFEPFDGPALCVRIFLSVLDVHINRAPMHGRIASITRRPGKYLNALKAESAEFNESTTLVLHHPTHGHPVAAVRQIAGAIARRIVTGVREGDTLQRGQRFGMIKFGSTTEVYLPDPARVQTHVRQGQYVWAGHTVLATVASRSDAPSPAEKRPPTTAAASNP